MQLHILVHFQPGKHTCIHQHHTSTIAYTLYLCILYCVYMYIFCIVQRCIYTLFMHTVLHVYHTSYQCLEAVCRVTAMQWQSGLCKYCCNKSTSWHKWVSPTKTECIERVNEMHGTYLQMHSCRCQMLQINAAITIHRRRSANPHYCTKFYN